MKPRRIRSLLREIVFVVADRFAHWIDPNGEGRPKAQKSSPSNAEEKP